MAFLLPRKVFKQKRKKYYIPYISCKPCRSREGGDGGGGYEPPPPLENSSLQNLLSKTSENMP